MSREMIVTRLELAAAKAKQLAEDTKHSRLWPGDLSRGIAEAVEQLETAQQEARKVGIL